jgi:hypothetical protein
LADDGRLVLDGLGEETEREILELRYPEFAAARVTGEDVVGAVWRERLGAPCIRKLWAELVKKSLSCDDGASDSPAEAK